jgi:hypothetical protein
MTFQFLVTIRAMQEDPAQRDYFAAAVLRGATVHLPTDLQISVGDVTDGPFPQNPAFSIYENYHLERFGGRKWWEVLGKIIVYTWATVSAVEEIARWWRT